MLEKKNLYFLQIEKELKLSHFAFVSTDCLLQLMSVGLILLSNVYCTGLLHELTLIDEQKYSKLEISKFKIKCVKYNNKNYHLKL